MTTQAETQTGSIQTYGYRWVVLGVFVFFTMMVQVFWIAFAPITSQAAQYYGVSEIQINFLALSFMYIYIPLAIPASWAIDKYGFKITVGAAAVIYAVCGLARGIGVGSFVERDRHALQCWTFPGRGAFDLLCPLSGCSLPGSPPRMDSAW